MLVETGFWPKDVPFDTDELTTVVTVINERAKQAEKRRRAR